MSFDPIAILLTRFHHHSYASSFCVCLSLSLCVYPGLCEIQRSSSFQRLHLIKRQHARLKQENGEGKIDYMLNIYTILVCLSRNVYISIWNRTLNDSGLKRKEVYRHSRRESAVNEGDERGGSYWIKNGGGGFALSLAPPLHPSHIEYSISIDADLKTSGNASVYFF